MKKILALIIIIVLSFTTCFVACDKEGGDVGDSDSSSVNTADQSGEKSADDPSSSGSSVEEYTITVENGTGSGVYQKNAIVTATATIPEGKVFVKWVKNGVDLSSSNPLIFGATENMTLTAVFEDEPIETKYTIIIENGTGGGEYEEGEQVIATATVPDRKIFVKWISGTDYVSSSNPYIFNAVEDKTLTAVFTDEPVGTETCVITVEGGTGSGEYEIGSQVTVTAIVPEGETFVKWVSDNDDEYTDNPFTFVATEDITLTAQFEKADPDPIKEAFTYAPLEIESFAYSGKALTFEYKAVDDSSNTGNTISFALFADGWKRVTDNIVINVVTNSISADIGVIEDEGNGWKKVKINLDDMPINTAENATGKEDVVHIHFDPVTHAFMLDNVCVTDKFRSGVEVSREYGYTSAIFKVENFASSGKALTFEYKPVGDRLSGNDDYVTFSLMSGWTRVTGYMNVDVINNTINGGIGKIEDVGDGWKKVTINCSEMPINSGEGATGNETVTLLNFHYVNHAFVFDNAGFTDEYRKTIEISTPNGYSSDNSSNFVLENFASSGKALTFEYKPVGDRLSGDSDDVTFSLMSGWDRVTAYITVDITNNTVRSNDIYIGNVEEIDDGWYKVTVNCSEMTLDNATGSETVNRIYFQWVNHAFLFANAGFTDAVS